MLLLKYGRNGISQDQFNSAIDYLESIDTTRYTVNGVFDIDAFAVELLSGYDRWRDIIYNTIRIYQNVSTKDEQKANFLSYIVSILSHRSSLKTYLNKGFGSVNELSNKDIYFVSFDKESNSYRVGIGVSMFQIREGDVNVPLAESSFWMALR